MKKRKPVIERINVKEGIYPFLGIYPLYPFENPSGYITEMGRESRNITFSGILFITKLAVCI